MMKTEKRVACRRATRSRAPDCATEVGKVLQNLRANGQHLTVVQHQRGQIALRIDLAKIVAFRSWLSQVLAQPFV